MSYDIFKQNMIRYMGNQGGIKSHTDWAKSFTLEYDSLIRRGYQTINQVSIQKGNIDLMEIQVSLACNIALQKQKGLHDVINDIGKGMTGYWTGAILNQFPTPTIPAVGSFQNISTTSAMVSDPGKFPDLGDQYPTTDTGQFLDSLISGIRIHLTTVKGIYNTVSLYPGVPILVAPGFLQWTGYTIP